MSLSLCSPALASLAIFTALIVLDIVNKTYNQIFFHVVTGIFSVIGLSVICGYIGEGVSWALFSVPFLVLVVGFLLIWIDSQKESVKKPASYGTPIRACPCLSCRSCPCRCGMNIPAPPPPVGTPSSCAPLPDSVTSLPPRKPESTLGCPTKT
jgi:hypothetical protein